MLTYCSNFLQSNEQSWKFIWKNWLKKKKRVDPFGWRRWRKKDSFFGCWQVAIIDHWVVSSVPAPTPRGPSIQATHLPFLVFCYSSWRRLRLTSSSSFLLVRSSVMNLLKHHYYYFPFCLFFSLSLSFSLTFSPWRVFIFSSFIQKRGDTLSWQAHRQRFILQ